MAPVLYPRVEKIVSSVIPASLLEFFSRAFFSMETHYIHALNSNERITLFSFTPPPDPVDAQSERKLVFCLKQIDCGLSFPFSGFIHSVFRFFQVMPRTLTPNSILFMSAFEAMCRSWGFAPFLGLIRAFFKIVKANNGFLSFCSRYGLSIFTGHKDSIKHWMEHFATVGAKRSFDWGLELRWGVVEPSTILFLFSPSGNITRITFLPFKYDVFKCLDICLGEDCYSAGTDHLFAIALFIVFTNLCFLFGFLVFFFSFYNSYGQNLNTLKLLP